MAPSRSGRVLHVLAQRPGRTGSGTTLHELVREASRAGWDQHAIVGVPVDELEPDVAELPGERVHALRFGGSDLPFDVPGMSDVMPYASSRFGELSAADLARYRDAWRQHLTAVIQRVRPDVVHAHHAWIATAMLAVVAPELPTVVHVHSTGLRQMRACPELAQEVRAGCARHAGFVVLHEGQVAEVVEVLGVPRERITVVGAGYREELFHAEGRRASRGDGAVDVLFVGKLSAAKGLPWLLDAFAVLGEAMPHARLHVVGAGHGDEGEALRQRMASMAPRVIEHGVLSPAALAERMRQCDVCVLPSFAEGLPLVLVEAAASGCRLVATALEPVTRVLVPALGERVVVVPLPGGDTGTLDAQHVDALARGVRRAVELGPSRVSRSALRAFGWRAVFERVERVWCGVSG